MGIRVLLLLLLVNRVFAANPYWVSPTGGASWAAAQSATPLSGTACASLATCNANITAGNTANFRGGTYSTHVFPAFSGATNNPIQLLAYNGEVPVISNGATAYAGYFFGLNLVLKSWVKVSGFTFERNDSATEFQTYLVGLLYGSSYNEIDNCTFDGRYRSCAMAIWDGSSNPNPSGTPCVHNWIHGCTFKNVGELRWNGSYVDDLGGFQLGVPTYDQDSNRNTFENCTFYGGGHHLLETFTKYNVIRNNFFHNEGFMTNSTGHGTYSGADTNGLWGNRNIQIYDGHNNSGMFNLLEGNRFGTSGPSPDDDGGDGLVITAPGNIIRYNTVLNALNNAVMFKVGSGSFSNTNRFYNNSLFLAGRYRNTNAGFQGALIRFYGGYTNFGTQIKNNILYRYGGVSEIVGGPPSPQNYGTILTNNWLTATGDPLFASTNTTDWTSQTVPNLNLTAGSGAIDTAIPLTTTVGAGSASTSLTVADALYFQDGTWGSVLAGHLPDKISVETVTNLVTISSINYSTKVITLASAITWTNGSSIWLYARNDGTRVLYGSAPDKGALESNLQSFISVTATDTQAGEPGSGFGSGTFTFTRSGGDTTTNLTVVFTVTGTATSGTDFTSIGTTVTILANELTATKTITVTDDGDMESSETVIVTISTDGAYVESPTAATVTINDDDFSVDTVTVSSPDDVAGEPLSGDGTAQFVFTRSNPALTNMTVNYLVTGTAASGVDYAPLGLSIIILSGDTKATNTVTVIDDAGAEDTETITTTITTNFQAYLVALTNFATVTITDDDPIVTVVATDDTAGENINGTGTFTFTRTGLTSLGLTVDFTVSSSTALSGIDYTSIGTQVVFSAGSATATKTVTVLDDPIYEGLEFVSVTIIGGSLYHAGNPNSASISVVDDEFLPTVRFGARILP